MKCQKKGLLLKCKENRLINEPEDAVHESLRGIAMINSGLVILNGHNVLLRRDYCNMPNKVKIISGGGSGNEPAFSGYIGPGMLTAAIFGHINSAPTIHSIYTVIKELGTNHAPGILIIIQNYPGYVLNFNLAKIQAEKEGINIKLLIVEDELQENENFNRTLTDVNKKEKLLSFRGKSRGLLGTLFIHKIAGAMAENEIDLCNIFAFCNDIAYNNIRSIGFSTRIPAACVNEVIYDKMEIGCGVHGERGKRQIEFKKSRQIASILVKALLEKQECCKNKDYAIMISNLGGSSQLETNILAKEIIEQISVFHCNTVRVYAGHLMTSLNYNGFQLSFFNVSNPDILRYLDAPTLAPNWPQILSIKSLGMKNEKDCSNIIISGNYIQEKVYSNKFERSNSNNTGPLISASSAQAFNKIIIYACDGLIACAKQIDIIDEETGDGDCGTSLSKGAEAIRLNAKNNRLITSRPATALLQISETIKRTMNGLQGGLYSIFFENAAKVFENTNESEEVTTYLWLKSLTEGNKALMEATDTQEGDRTMIDPLLAAEAALKNTIETHSLRDSIAQAVSAAEEKGIESTHMTVKVGTASLLEDQTFKHPDAGAHAVGVWMRAMFEGIKMLLINNL